MPPLYRSPNTPHGFFNDLGTVHIHIDGAHDLDLVLSLLHEFEKLGCAVKLDHILSSIPGPQRQTLPKTYQSHTPGNQKEEFDYFATILIKHPEQLSILINRLLKQLPRQSGIILEVERVIGKIHSSNQHEKIGNENFDLLLKDIIQKPSASLPIEIHHTIDIPKQGPPPFELPRLLQDTMTQGIELGGWFLFDKGELWAYRSNSFAKIDQAQEIASQEYQSLQAYLEQQKHPYQLRTLIENVLGIWRI